jgi:hypothetical protein
MIRSVAFLSVFLCCTFTAPHDLSATDLSFPDLISRSKNGVYSVEAKSLDNAKKPDAVFQTNFEYELTHIPSRKKVWEWKPQKLPAPISLNIHDSGVVVVGDCWDNFWVVDLSGKATQALEFDDVVPQSESKLWASHTFTARYWSGHSLFYFCQIKDELHFVVRTYWDRRLVINVDEHSTVKDLHQIEHDLDRTEAQISLNELQAAAKNQFDFKEDYKLRRRIHTAALIAGKLGVREAIPLLLQLESVANEPDTTENCSRQIAQLSLRRMNVAPAGYFATCVRFKKEGPNWNLRWPASRVARSQKADDLHLGDSRIQVLATVGSPDFISPRYVEDLKQGDTVWDYDMDATEPFTLRLVFRDEKLLKATQIEPVWRNTAFRDQYLAPP